MAHPTVVPFDISKQLFFVKEQNSAYFNPIWTGGGAKWSP